MSKRTFFFADYIDLQSIAESLKEQPIRYFKAGSFDNDSVLEYSSLIDIPSIGIAASGISTLLDYYIVLPSSLRLNVRAVTQNAGGVKYFVDQLKNPVSIIIRIGGEWNKQAIIPTTVDTLYNDTESLKIFNNFAQIVRRFKKIDSVAIGESALAKFKEGYRLTDDVRQLISDDLKR